MSTLTSAAARAVRPKQPVPEKPTPANAFILDRMGIVDGTPDRIIDYEVVPKGNGAGRELKVSFVAGPERYRYTHTMSEETVMAIIAHPLANRFDKMTLSAGLGKMRTTVSYGLNKY